MSTVIGQLTLNGTDAQNAALRAFAEKVQQVVGPRIEPVSVLVKPRAVMPRYRDARPGDGPTDGRARGFWRARRRVILLADDLFRAGEPLEETLGHEIVHAMFEKGIAERSKMLPLLIPEPENFADQVVFGRDRGYAGTPEEALAVWGSAALFDFAPPAYVDLFKRSVAKPSLPALRALLLGPAPVPAPVPEPTPDPLPPPPDLVAENAALRALLTVLRDGNAEVAAQNLTLANKANSGIGGGNG